MNNQQKIITLWLLLVVSMLLHQTFHLSKLFYGINVARPGADGIIPDIVYIKRIGFYILPMIYISFLLFVQAKWIRVMNFGISLIYTGINIMNLTGEFGKKTFDYSQVLLLSFIVIASLLLNFASLKFLQEYKTQQPVKNV